jgi:hypothetical protein
MINNSKNQYLHKLSNLKFNNNNNNNNKKHNFSLYFLKSKIYNFNFYYFY